MLSFEEAAHAIDAFYERKLTTEDSIGRAMDLRHRRIKEFFVTGQINADVKKQLIDRYRLINKGRPGFYSGPAAAPTYQRQNAGASSLSLGNAPAPAPAPETVNAGQSLRLSPPSVAPAGKINYQR